MVASVSINFTVAGTSSPPTLNGLGAALGATGVTTGTLTVGNVAVGDVVYASVLTYDTAAPTVALTDNLGNTATFAKSVVDASGLCIQTYRFPITVAGNQVLTATFQAAQNYPYLYAAHMQPPAGLGFTGMDFAVSADHASGTLTLTGTTTVANDVLVSTALNSSDTEVSFGTGQTMLYDGRASSGGCITWSQAGAAGTVNHTYTDAGGPTVGMLVAEKIGAAPLTVSVNPSSYTAPVGSVPAAGTPIAQASAAGGDGNPETFSLGGSNPDPNLVINPSTGAITSQGDEPAEGKTYQTTVTVTQS